MRPGLIRWAENDNHAAGADPWSGQPNKVVPAEGKILTGRVPEELPPAEETNWLIHRLALASQAAARLQAANYTRETDTTTDHQGGQLLAACHSGSGTIQRVFLFAYDAVAGTIEEQYGPHGVGFAQPASSPCTAGGLVATPTVDADGDSTNRRIIVVDDGIVADLVRFSTSTAGASWAFVTFTAGAPGYSWQVVGCDRDTAGAGSARWTIGGFDFATGHTRVFSSTDGVNFAIIAGWDGSFGGTLRACIHSLHPALALGPDDAGNPIWMLLSNTHARVSTDGTTWTAHAHGLALGGGSFGPRSLSYSRIGTRWVAVLPAAAGGDVAYSDDNGATWTTIAGAISVVAGQEPRICSDGHGTFVISQDASSGAGTLIHVSTDNGLTWTAVQPPSDFVNLAAASLDGGVCEAVYDESLAITETSYGAFFVLAYYNDTGPTTEIHRSLVV